MRHLNEFEASGGFEDYHGFVYIDRDILVRSSADDRIVGIKTGVDDNGNVTYMSSGHAVSVDPPQSPIYVVSPQLTWWQRLMRWIGWLR